MKTAMLPGSVSRLAGGLFTSVRRLSESMADLPDCEVIVVGHQDEHTEQDLTAWRVTPDLLQSKNRVARRGELYDYLSHESFDVIHTQFLWSYASAAVAKRSVAPGAPPHVISPRGMLDPWAVKHHRWKKRAAGWMFENQHLRRAACMHALCDSEARAIREHGIKAPICVIPNGIDLPDLSQENPIHSESQPYKTLLSIGRLHPKKGLHHLIEAWAIAMGCDPSGPLNDWHLILAGWSEMGYADQLQQQISDLNLSSKIDLIGSVYGDKKRQLLREADGFILPSHSEGLPMSILEAWAYRLPVWMTPHCNLPIGYRRNAAIEIQTDAHELANRLLEMATMSERQRTEMGLMGRSLVENHFQWSQIAEQMEATYRWIRREGERPECMVS